MSDWPGWDSQLLTAINSPPSKEDYAVIHAEQAVEGAGGAYNPYNIGYYGSNPQYHGYTPFGTGKESPYPPTLDFPNPQAGIWATGVWYGSNAPDLLAALRRGNPLESQWTIHMGASTPDPQYTAKVRSLAESYLGGATSPPTTPPAGNPGTQPASSGCASDNMSIGACGSSGIPPCAAKPNQSCAGAACCASGFGSSGDVTGTCSDANCSQCCGSGIGGGTGGNQQSGGGSGGGCQCAHVHIPLLGGFNLLPCFLCDFFDAITSEAFWIRAGEILLGVILLGIGLTLAGKRFGAGRIVVAARSAATSAA